MLLIAFMTEERFFYVPQATENSALPQEEAGHAVRVLRLKEGDSIVLIDGEGGIHQAEVTLASNKKCEYRIISSQTSPEPQFPTTIHIAIAPTKMMERMEWMAEKATEIGIDEISFLESQYSERRTMRSDRIEKTVISAMKQSRKAWKPVINDLMPLKDFLDIPREGRKFICHCHNEISRNDLYKEILSHKGDASQQNVTILIGPEGDFSKEEVQYALKQGYESVSLGESRLRTETAALVALMTIRLGAN